MAMANGFFGLGWMIGKTYEAKKAIIPRVVSNYPTFLFTTKRALRTLTNTTPSPLVGGSPIFDSNDRAKWTYFRIGSKKPFPENI